MILLIDNFDSFTYNIYQYLSQLTPEPIRVLRNDEVTIDEIEQLAPDRIVISPGPGRPEDAGVSVEVVRRFSGRVPILGVCLGHQAIAYAFGGRIVGARRIVHGKVDEVVVDGQGLFRSVNSPAAFVRYHSLAVEESSIPQELEVTARSRDGEVMGLRHRVYTVEGVQFHPESIASDAGMKVLGNFLNYRREPFQPRDYLNRLISGRSLSQREAAAFMGELTSGHLSSAQIAGFLVAFNAKGIRAEEVAGCAEVLREKRTPLDVAGPTLDTCGTGGDGLDTFNISSLTALVAAAAGARVAKHGNRAVSSRSGSADFYRALGMNIDTSPAVAAECLAKTGFAFLYAPRYHSAMRFAATARRELGIKTIMNLLGPLANPAGAEYQLIGVHSDAYLQLMAEAAVRVGGKRGMVVHGRDGQDEVSVCGPTDAILFDVTADTAALTPDERVAKADFKRIVISPPDVGVATHPIEALLGGTAEDNASLAGAILGSDPPARDRDETRVAAVRDAIVMNAAAALLVSNVVSSLTSGVDRARSVLSSGAAGELLKRVIECTKEEPAHG